MSKFNPFLPPRISPTNTKLYDLENQGQCHYPLLTLENSCMSHTRFIINTRVQVLVFLQFYTT